MLNKNQIKDYYYFVYPNCNITKGYKRAIIIDTEVGKLNEIPIELFEILTEYNKLKISDVLKKYGEENRIVLIEYFQWLYSENIIYLTLDKNDFDCFEVIPNEWISPYEITNGIIDIDEESKHDVLKRLKLFIDLKIPHIEIRFFCKIILSEFETILFQILNSEVQSLICYLPFNNEFSNHSLLQEKVKNHLRLSTICIYSSPTEKRIELNEGHCILDYLNQDITNKHLCGNIGINYFVSSASFQREAHSYNTCLNKKVSIDVTGEIKNCPSMPKSYGNIKNTTLEEAINKRGFKDVWGIKKDEINICKDCEFRYICPDCRAYIEKPDDIYSKPLKCGYSPYTGIWEEWSTNPLKQRIINYYNKLS